jgi:hypothetical protein
VFDLHRQIAVSTNVAERGNDSPFHDRDIRASFIVMLA